MFESEVDVEVSVSKRAVLLNSTSTYLHLGCYLTMSGLRKLLALSGIDVVFECGVNQEDLCAAKKILGSSDEIFLVVNGEGTFHDDQPYAIKLLDFSLGLKNRKLLLNAQLKNFSQSVLDKISTFDFIQVRTWADYRYATAAGLSNLNYCPDMLFFSGVALAPVVESSGRVVFTDSHVRLVSEQLAEMYKKTERKKHWVNFHFLPIGFDLRLHYFKITISRVKRYLGLNSEGYSDLNLQGFHACSDLIKVFLGADIVVTGRYHAACLAIALGKKLVFSDSNTSKVRDLCEDFCCGVHVNDLGSELLLDDVPVCAGPVGAEVYFSDLVQCIKNL